MTASGHLCKSVSRDFLEQAKVESINGRLDTGSTFFFANSPYFFFCLISLLSLNIENSFHFGRKESVGS